MNQKLLAYILLVGGILGVFASFEVTIEKMRLLQDASYIPPCNISPFISCGSVMQTPQASLLGFPNSLLGLMGYAFMATVGLALLAGAKFKRWFWLLTQAPLTGAIIFVYWLFYQGLYVIGSLCLYCLLIWIVTIPMFWYLTLHNVADGHLPFINHRGQFASFIQAYPLPILLFFYLIIILGILTRFWHYWVTII